MYKLRTEFTFSSAHALKDYKGECANLHGHNWKVEIFLIGDRLDDVGMLLDFKIIKEKIYLALKKLDHSFLNDIVDFNPTAENLSKHIYFELKPYFVKENVSINRIRVWENDKNYCEFFEQ